jgi:hypothetical protein
MIKSRMKTRASKGEMRDICRLLEGQLEGKIHLGRHRHRWTNNIKMNLKETGSKAADLIRLS